jgi:hypothetical protein
MNDIAKTIRRIKLFRGDQIVIPGIQPYIDSYSPHTQPVIEKKKAAKKRRRQKPVQLLLLDFAKEG